MYRVQSRKSKEGQEDGYTGKRREGGTDGVNVDQLQPLPIVSIPTRLKKAGKLSYLGNNLMVQSIVSYLDLRLLGAVKKAEELCDRRSLSSREET